MSGKEESGHAEGHEKKKYEYFVNGVKYETDQSALTGLQIKAKVPNWDPSQDLVLNS